MSYTVLCPDCGSIRTEHHHSSAEAASQASERDVRFAQVLNGRQWREKPVVAPRERDDIVPND